MTRSKKSSSNKMESPGTLSVRVEHHRDAFGIGTDRPRLSWIVETTSSGWHQAGKLGEYTIQDDPDLGLNVLLGPPFIYNKDNIDQFNW